ncbi:uncharacterized protein N7446_007825 [Penicillium canescens]|uniref:Xylanolytic transcriptional activator regulatory domain-containing protein n=1 Tax=Penicillium canescens TaxID=5083 RepID=A0AAD6IM43_PENCN|nr:uncharacterized protein N7446_007825 [Penicillium canescens]KAJ6033878.1 hypothetical protein N7444_011649 [Penicillium canescens]KAJ6056932.1 hypothetical protein N7460_000206 [Penicillium canescens]KAJ6058242.1 hypothetical protein N7446_007825 [Penicillium canescens]
MNQQRAVRLEERISFMENLLSNKLADNFLGKPINTSAESDADQSQMKDLASIQQGFFTLAGKGGLAYDKYGCCDSDPTTIIPQARKLVLSILGHSVNLQGLFRPSPPWQCFESEHVRQALPVPGLMKLPDISIINDCVTAYFSSSVRFLLPIIDRTLFKNTINLAFSASSADYPGTSTARACIWAFLSLCSMWNFPGVHVLPVNAFTLATEVENYMPRVLQEDTIDGLQTLLMLLLFHSSSGNLRNGLFLDSLVARLIYRFGAHVNSPPASGEFFHENGLSPVDHHLRNLFWIAYILDKELCIRMGQPAAIQDEACDLTLPPGYAGQLAALGLASERGQLEPRGHLYLTDLRLIKIKSRVYSAIYGPAALHKPDADLLKSIRELDEELEQWRLSIPSQYRPSLSTAPQPMTNTSHHIRMHSILLQVDYYHCVAILHQACGRSKAWTSGETNGVDGIGTSFILAVESSRSSLLFLRNVLPTLPEGTFW